MPEGKPIEPPEVTRIQGSVVFQLLFQADPQANQLFSPISAEIILAVLLAGVQGDSESAIRQLLGLDDTDGEILLYRLAEDLKRMWDGLEKTELAVGTAFWYQKGRLQLRPDLEEVFREVLAMDVRGTDFNFQGAAQADLDAWLAEATRGKITAMPFPSRPPWVPRDQPFPLFTGANAVHLKAKWRHAFDPYTFMTDFFHCGNGKVQELFFIERRDCRGSSGTSYLRGDGFHAVQIPFEDKGLAMEIFLPLEDDEAGAGISFSEGRGVVEGRLEEMMGKIAPGDPGRWAAEFRPQEHMFLLLPVFEANAEVHFSYGALGKALSPLFRPSWDYDGMFTKAIEEDELGLADGIQAGGLRMDAAGVEAAAVATVSSRGVGASARLEDELVVFEADRPFFYRILHPESQRVLYMGTLVNPVPTGDPEAAHGQEDREITPEERIERKAYRRSMVLYDRLRLMEEDADRSAWARQRMGEVLVRTGLESSHWAELGQQERWQPLVESLNSENGGLAKDKFYARHCAQELEKLGWNHHQAVSLVRQAARYPVLVLLAALVFDGNFILHAQYRVGQMLMGAMELGLEW